MTTLMNQQQADALRSVGDAASVLWAMWIIDQNYPGRMTKAKELLPYLYPTYKDVRKIETQLNSLCASGRMTQTIGGYVLLEGGKALFLQFSSDNLALSPVNTGTGLTQAQVVVIDAEENQKNLGESAREMRALKKIEEGDESIKLNLSLSSSTSDSSLVDAQNADGLAELLEREFGDGNVYPKVFDMLTKTSTLFGRPGVFVKKLKTSMLHPRQVLGWMAHAYDQWVDGGNNGKLKNPAGLVYSKLLELDRPNDEYMDKWREILPESYLEAIGLMEYLCEGCEQIFKTRTEFQKHEDGLLPCQHDCGLKFHTEEERLEHHSNHAEVSQKFKPLGSEHQGVKVWNLVKETLCIDMPRASFDTWVRDTQPVLFEGDDLTVCVRNAYARDWLESRLTATVKVLMETYLHRNILVKFVVGSVEGEDEL